MPNQDWEDEDESDDSDEGAGPDESDMDHSDEPELVQCPHCRKYVSEEAERCHHCGSYLSAEDAPSRLSWWVIVGVALAGLAALVWVSY